MLIASRYECSTEIDRYQNTIVYWTHVCVRKDRRIALTARYITHVRRLTMPVIHIRGDDTSTDEPCSILKTLSCSVHPASPAEIERLREVHSGKMEPGLEFWNVAYRALERTRVPWNM